MSETPRAFVAGQAIVNVARDSFCKPLLRCREERHLVPDRTASAA
jgi:hypothetical protein